MADLARLVVEVDSSGVVTAVKNLDDFKAKARETETATHSFNEKWESLSTTLSNSFFGLQLLKEGFTMISDVVGEMIEKYTEAEQASIKLDAVYKATGGTVGVTTNALRALADELSRHSLVDNDAVVNAEALMLTFKSVRQEGFEPAMKAALDLSATFGMDLNSATVMLGKALEDPISGLTSLRRVGVSFTDSEEAMIKAMNAANDSAGAQAEILKVVNGQVAGVADQMSNSASGAFIKLGQATDDLKEELGRVMAEGLRPFVDGMTDQIRAMLDTRTEAEKLADKYAELAEKSRSVLGPVMEQNDQQAITQQQFTDLIRLYPELVTQITAYSTTVEEARKKVKGLNDENAVTIKTSLMRQITDLTGDEQLQKSGFQKLATQWNKYNPGMQIGDSLNADTQKQIADLLQQDKDANFSLIKPALRASAYDMLGAISAFMEDEANRKLIAAKYDQYSATGTLTAPAMTNSPVTRKPAPGGSPGDNGTVSDMVRTDLWSIEGWTSDDLLAPYKQRAYLASILARASLMGPGGPPSYHNDGGGFNLPQGYTDTWATSPNAWDRDKPLGPPGIESLTQGKGIADSLGIKESDIKNVAALADAFNLSASEAAGLYTMVGNLGTSLATIAAQDAVSMFSSLGEAMASGTDASGALGDMALKMLDQLPMLLLQAGLNAMLLGPTSPTFWMGLAMVAASGVTAFVDGAAHGAITSAQKATEGTISATKTVNDAIITKDGQVINTHPDDNLYAFKALPGGGKGGGSSVVVHNYSGAQVQTQEKTGANGQRELILMIGQAVNQHIADGRADRVAGARWGVGFGGRSAS